MNDRDEQSVGGALFQTSSQIGYALGICLSALIVSEVESDKGALLAGLRAGYWYSSATCFIGEWQMPMATPLLSRGGGAGEWALGLRLSCLVIPVVLVGMRGVGLAKDVRNDKRGDDV